VRPPRPSDFPELRRTFAGYLHEDFPEEYGTPAAALRAFRDDANPTEQRRFSREVSRFLDRTSQLDFSEVQKLVARLGCRWTPPSRAALIELLIGEGHEKPRGR
jgi:hypothetical protein